MGTFKKNINHLEIIEFSILQFSVSTLQGQETMFFIMKNEKKALILNKKKIMKYTKIVGGGIKYGKGNGIEKGGC